MGDEQIGLRGDGEFYCREAGVHGGGEARDAVGIFHLQAVDRAVVVADLGGAENFVAVRDDGFKLNFRHDAMKANRGETARREKCLERSVHAASA